MDNIHMKAIELVGEIDEQHRLQGQVPNDVPPGQVRLIVLLPDEDEAGAAWAQGVAKAWAAELCWREARPHNGHSVNLARRNRR
jgi:hypothetical protein